MKKRHTTLSRTLTAAVFGAALLLPVSRADAHCDSLDGPVINDARAALQRADVTPVLKWIRPTDEGEVKKAFQKALTLRGKGAESRSKGELAFFETLVRVHRAGEGAGFTGLKKSVTEAGPAVVGADQALETGSPDALVKLLAEGMAEGVRHRFARARELKAHVDESVAAGREYVAAYVDYVHYVEGLHTAAAKEGGHHDHAEHAAAAGHAEHPKPAKHTKQVEARDRHAH